MGPVGWIVAIALLIAVVLIVRAVRRRRQTEGEGHLLGYGGSSAPDTRRYRGQRTVRPREDDEPRQT